MLTFPSPVQTRRCSRQIRLAAAVAGLAGLAGQALCAAGNDPTTLSPFRVEAEFGVDGLRIQNSTSVLNPYLLGQHGVSQLQDISGVAPNRNTARFTQESYGLVNTQLRYRVEAWTLAVYAQNLFDRHHYQFINPEIHAGSPGAPRRFGVQVSFEY